MDDGPQTDDGPDREETRVRSEPPSPGHAEVLPA
jgi:hypothetical protein